jgi:RNA polymerase sigma-70 factor (ECF subfamily)
VRAATLVPVDARDPNAIPDADLVARVAAGDGDALRMLYDRYARMLLTRLHRRCADRDVVDTALQDTFVSVWRSARRFRPDGGEVGAWLWSIAVRRLIDQLRRRRPPVPTEHLPEPEPLPPPGTPMYDLLARLRCGLPPDLHGVVEAVHVDGLTTAEAAVLLGIPQGTVKSRLHRARPHLADLAEALR